MEKENVRKLVLCAVLSALVVILQLLGSFIRFGPFSVSLVLLPIVVGAALCGKRAAAWLGLVFGAVVLVSGSALFLAVNAPGTVVTVIGKGVLCGLCAGITFSALQKYGIYTAVASAAVVCPVVNTGVFLLCCRLFFWETLGEWASAAGFGDNVTAYMFLGLVGANFAFELLTNIILSPVIVRLLKIGKTEG